MRTALAMGSGFSNANDPPPRNVEIFNAKFVKFSTTYVWEPQVNVYETTTAFIICVNLSGMRSEDIHVDVDGFNLVISGTRAPPALPADVAGDVSVHLMEIDRGEFRREIEIRTPVRQETISAQYQDGLLWITLPKRD